MKDFPYEIAKNYEHISIDEWFKRYKPIEDYDYSKIRKENPKKAWTLIQGDNDNFYLTTGFRRVNSFHTYITEKEWDLWDEVIILVTEDDYLYYGQCINEKF